MKLLDLIDNFIAKISMPPCPDGTHFHPGVNRCHDEQTLHQKSKVAHGTVKKPVGKLQKQQISRVVGQPPGPPPRPGLQWKRETARWIRPEFEEKDESAHTNVSALSESKKLTFKEKEIADSIIRQYRQKGHISDKQWDVLHSIHEKYAVHGGKDYEPTQQDNEALSHLQSIARPINFQTSNRDLNAMYSLLEAYKANNKLSEKQWNYAKTLAKKFKNTPPPSKKEITDMYDYSIREFRGAKQAGNNERAFDMLEQAKKIKERYNDFFAQ